MIIGSLTLVLRRVDVFLGFFAHFLSFLFILLFAICLLKPIPVSLKSDKNIQQSSSETLERAETFFVVSKKSDIPSENSTGPTSSVNNKTLTSQNLHNTTGTGHSGTTEQKSDTSEGEKGTLGTTAGNNTSNNPSLGKSLNETSIISPSNSSDTSLQGPGPNGTLSVSVDDNNNTSVLNVTTSIITETPDSPVTTILKVETHIYTTTETSVSTSISISTITNTVTELPTKSSDKSYTTTTETSASSTSHASPSTTSASDKTDIMDINHEELDSAKHKNIFGEGSLIAILIPLAVFIVIFIALIWFWCRRRRRSSKMAPKRVGNYKITPIINDSSEGIQRTNYSEKDELYCLRQTESNKGGYRGWGPTGTPTNNKSSLSRNQSLSSANVSPAYQKPDYYFSRNNTEKDSDLITSKRMTQNSKSLEPRNLHAQIFNTGKNSNYSTSPYSLNSQNTMESFNRNAALLDYDPNVAKENYSNKLFSESRRNGLLRQNPPSFHRYTEKSEMNDFSKGS
ncbi:hypothetical protein MERGE_003179 [Pneumocystis wakefieldiae]|uniref:Uncharacterized protein n=1 Tax=Pneumocystis wakefieldiae TaxID=38082 RepID=A0A899G1H0_9ASCO|nr:hypothetical protein MERGE_003179 [Pneumocystis wakefieldiae]